MKFENLNCKIQVFSSINPSEDPEKIKKAILNILPHSEIKIDDSSISAQTNELRSLEKIHESIHSRQLLGVFKRQLERHQENNSTWFYLNKQTAFVKKVVLCEEADESPLGPLKVVLTSPKLEQIIDCLLNQEKFS